MSERQKLTWVVPKWPFPMEDGARVATVQLLRNLTELGHPIDLVAVVGDQEKVSPEEAQKKLGVQRVHVIRRRSGRAAMLGRSIFHPFTPVTMQPYASSEVRRQMSEILKDASPWIVYDGLHPAAHASCLDQYQRPRGLKCVVYRAHNYETAIWRRKVTQTRFWPMKTFLALQSRQVHRFEKSLLMACDGLAPVSEEDLRWFKDLKQNVNARVVPIGYDFDAPLARARPSENSKMVELMFLGRMDWPPNKEGLVWFLEKVWKRALERNPNLKLSVAGSGNSDWIQAYLGLPNVRFLGRVERVEDLYASSAVSLVPVFYGSGTRVKVIEASRFGRACLSTAIGVEGTGLVEGESYIRAETMEEWIEQLERITPEYAREVGVNANEQLKKIFDVRRTAQEFSELISSSAKSGVTRIG